MSSMHIKFKFILNLNYIPEFLIIPLYIKKEVARPQQFYYFENKIKLPWDHITYPSLGCC